MFIPNFHGWAQQTNWIEVPPSGAGGYPSEFDAPGGIENKKFAQIVWNIGTAPVPTAPNDVPASVLTIIETYIDGTDSYICEAPINSALSVAVWRILLISKNGTSGPTVRYASFGASNLQATDLATVKAYTYS